jgi:hypothetical protein
MPSTGANVIRPPVLLVKGGYGSATGQRLYNKDIQVRIIATLQSGRKIYSNYLRPQYFGFLN